tara:strand:+ start:664 stop:1113 length:450 start_codon:yes stop_codon:yes gene_type:complete
MKRPMNRPMNRPEQALQIHIVQYLAAIEQARRLTFFHPENGGYRTRAEAGLGKAMGRKAGVPDLVILSLIGRMHFIELKAQPPSGKYADDLAAGRRHVFDDPRLSREQKAFVAKLVSLGFAVQVCNTVDQVRDALVRWQIIGTEEFRIA